MYSILLLSEIILTRTKRNSGDKNEASRINTYYEGEGEPTLLIIIINKTSEISGLVAPIYWIQEVSGRYSGW